MPLSRREFLIRTGATGVTVGLAGSLDVLFTSLPAAGARGPTQGYGDLVPDPDGILDLPRGFRYRILSREGLPLKSEQGLVPSSFDGMGTSRHHAPVPT